MSIALAVKQWITSLWQIVTPLVIILPIFLVSCVLPRQNPQNLIDPIPAVWGEENCMGDIAIKASPITGHTSTPGYLWSALELNDTICISSNGFFIDSGDFSQSVIWMSINPMQIPEGQYKYYVFFSQDSSSIGNINDRLLSSGPQNFELSYSQVKGPVCIEATLGDSILFSVEVDSWGDKTIFINDSGQTVSGYSWQMLLNNDSLDEHWFVQLADSGLYFPLKVSDSKNDLRWVLKATNIYNLDDTVIAEIVVRRPTKLGNFDNDFDSLICYWGNKFAIPPQIIKSIIRKETYFDNLKYRYELNFDYFYFQPDVDSKSYYKLFLLADSARTASRHGFDKKGDSVSQGENVAELLADPYNVLRSYSLNPEVIVCDTVRDSLITGNELVLLNTRFSQHDSNFVAQIIINSSYGLMQPMHVSLIDFVSFKDSNPQSLLESENLAVYWGVSYFSYIYFNETSEYYEWDTRWRTAIGKYNGGVHAQETYGMFLNSDVENYVQTVLGFINLYQPLRSE
ncbi:MAG: hypothetical protein R3F48_17430 [Candidatus Zixiibacteriota bacterium]